jgi:hypothetical protein
MAIDIPVIPRREQTVLIFGIRCFVCIAFYYFFLPSLFDILIGIIHMEIRATVAKGPSSE